MLDLSSNCIGIDGTQALADALAQNTMLAEVKFLYNPMGHAGYQALVQAVLWHNTTLTRLELYHSYWPSCPLHYYEVPDSALATALRRNQTLKKYETWIQHSTNERVLSLILERMGGDEFAEQLVFAFFKSQLHILLPFLLSHEP